MQLVTKIHCCDPGMGRAPCIRTTDEISILSRARKDRACPFPTDCARARYLVSSVYPTCGSITASRWLAVLCVTTLTRTNRTECDERVYLPEAVHSSEAERRRRIQPRAHSN